MLNQTLILREIRMMLERCWTESEIAHKMCMSPTTVHELIAEFLL